MMTDLRESSSGYSGPSVAKLAGPSVTVLMTVYNSYRYLAIAVESILTQSYREFEFIIIDDGSTDGGRELLQDFANRDTRIRLFCRENTGQNAALNFGLTHATGKYIARMDSDDISSRGRLAAQISYLESHPECVAVGAAIDVIDPSGWWLFRRNYKQDHDSIISCFRLATCEIAHPVIIARRSDIIQSGGYDDSFKSAADFELWLRLSQVGLFHNLKEPLLRYRMHPSQMSSVRSREQARLTLAALAKHATALDYAVMQSGNEAQANGPGLNPMSWEEQIANLCWSHGSYLVAAMHFVKVARNDHYSLRYLIVAMFCVLRVPPGRARTLFDLGRSYWPSLARWGRR